MHTRVRAAVSGREGSAAQADRLVPQYINPYLDVLCVQLSRCIVDVVGSTLDAPLFAINMHPPAAPQSTHPHINTSAHAAVAGAAELSRLLQCPDLQPCCLLEEFFSTGDRTGSRTADGKPEYGYLNQLPPTHRTRSAHLFN